MNVSGPYDPRRDPKSAIFQFQALAEAMKHFWRTFVSSLGADRAAVWLRKRLSR